MKRSADIPEFQYGICPDCGMTINKTRKELDNLYMVCQECDKTWEAKYTYGYEDMIVSEKPLNNKNKKKQKEILVNKYDLLKLQINKAVSMEDLNLKFKLLTKADKDFKILCSKKYNAYFELGELNKNYFEDSYKAYLNSRSKKMILDIDKILFYFGK